MQHDPQDPQADDHDFPEHEPGDINGNIDPSFRKQPRRARARRDRARDPSTPSKGEQDSRMIGQPDSDTAQSVDLSAHPTAEALQTSRRARGRRRRFKIPASDRAERTARAESGPSSRVSDDISTEPQQELTPGAFGDPQRPVDSLGRRRRQRQRRKQLAGQGAQAVSPQAAEGAPAVEGERLHKVLAQQGLGSRRDMEALIAAGEVEVNGQRAHVGQIVNERDRVYVKRRRVKVKLGDDNPRVLIYHKPAGEIVSRDDPEQRPSVFDRLPKPDHGKWVAVGRLDYNSEGLLLFTTYGELANRLMHPRYEVSREYSVRVLGELTPEQEDQLIDGIELEDGPARVTSLERIDADSDSANHWYKLTLQEGRNREVRRMFEHLGLTVSRLIRTRYGNVTLPSWLKRGQWKLLDEHETFNLLESVGLRSRKKLEKAARFGGARGKLPTGPIGPMRSASEHEAAWLTPGGTLVRQKRGRLGRVKGLNGSASFETLMPMALQQQQFPGFGGYEADVMPGAKRRRRDGRSTPHSINGDVDGNRLPGQPPRGRKKKTGQSRARTGGQAFQGQTEGSAARPPAASRRSRRRRGAAAAHQAPEVAEIAVEARE